MLTVKCMIFTFITNCPCFCLATTCQGLHNFLKFKVLKEFEQILLSFLPKHLIKILAQMEFLKKNEKFAAKFFKWINY